MGTEKEDPAKKSTLWPLDMFDKADISENDANVSSSRELSQELNEVIALYNVGVVLNSSLNPKEVLWGIYKECSRLVNTSNFALTIFDESKESLIERNQAAIKLIESWLKDDSGYDEETFPKLKEALEESRKAVSVRYLFDD